MRRKLMLNLDDYFYVAESLLIDIDTAFVKECIRIIDLLEELTDGIAWSSCTNCSITDV